MAEIYLIKRRPSKRYKSSLFPTNTKALQALCKPFWSPEVYQWIELFLPIMCHQHCLDSGTSAKQLGYLNTEKCIAIVA